MKGIQIFFIPPFFVSMATAEKFVQPIPIFLPYFVPLDVDVVPYKFHQILFEIRQKNRNRLDKLLRSCHGNKKGGNKKYLDSFHQTS
jgi:hypothetical protein